MAKEELSMSTTLTVKGYFSNGRSRVAGIHWPGGSARTGKLGGAFLPEFQQRAVQYGKTFKSELEEAPKRADGLPKFEYMEIAYNIYLQNGGSYVENEDGEEFYFTENLTLKEVEEIVNAVKDMLEE